MLHNLLHLSKYKLERHSLVKPSQYNVFCKSSDTVLRPPYWTRSWKSQTDRWQGTTLSEFITHSATSCRHYWQISLQENLSDRAVPGGHKANIDQRGFPPRGLRQFTRLLVVLTATNAFSWIPQIVVAGDQRATNPQLKIFQWVQAFAEMSLDSRTTHSCLWGRRSMSDKNGCLDQSTMHIPAT